MKLRRSTAIACALAGALGLSTSASALTIDQTFNGFYVEVGDTSNRGLNLELFKVGPELFAGFVTGFTYDASGNQVWFSGTDTEVRPGDISIDFNINLATGGNPFGGAQTPSNAASQGTGSLVINTCNNVELNLSTNAGGSIPSVADLPLDRGQSLLGSIGFVGPDECAYQEPFPTEGCSAFPFSDGAGPVPRSCLLSGTELGDVTLTNNVLWVLDSTYIIGDPGSINNSNRITIEPGTRIVALPGGNAEAFVISRGAQIFAIGTPFAPVVFSSANPTTASIGAAAAGDFGGLVINGLATVNNCDPLPSGCVSEGIDDALYGGDDDFDSSGIMKYVRVQFGGDDITPNNQLNGIAFQGVGAGTVVDFIQVHSNDDDGIEWFGGTVRVTHAVVSGVSDDSLDWVNGWTGSLQYAVVDQQGQGDQGIEADNFDEGQTNTPRSQPKLANLTLNGSPSADIGMLFREGTGVNITNSIVKNFGEGCLDIDDDATFTQSFDGSMPNGTLTIQNTYFACDTPFIEEAGDLVDLSDFFDNQTGNTTFAGFSGIFPPAGASFLRGRQMDRSIFAGMDLVDFAGAFPSEGTAWTVGWTEFLD